MRLLFDHNLSPRLIDRLGNFYPDASHVSLVGLDRASDDAVWQSARAHDYIIVSKDADFTDLSVLRGFPPKVIWLRIGNCTTDQIEELLRTNHARITLFVADPDVGTLSLI